MESYGSWSCCSWRWITAIWADISNKSADIKAVLSHTWTDTVYKKQQTSFVLLSFKYAKWIQSGRESLIHEFSKQQLWATLLQVAVGGAGKLTSAGSYSAIIANRHLHNVQIKSAPRSCIFLKSLWEKKSWQVPSAGGRDRWTRAGSLRH